MYPLRIFLHVWLRFFSMMYIVSPERNKSRRDNASSRALPATTDPAATIAPTAGPPVVPVTAVTPSSTAAQSVTAAATFSTLPEPPTSLPRTPLDDPRVGWIYQLRQGELRNEMQKYGLETEGTIDELRKTFVSFWRQPFGIIPPSAPYSQPPQTLNIDPALRVPEFSGLDRLDVANDVDERFSIREILGLSPNADSGSVKRILASMMHGVKSDDRPHNRHPSEALLRERGASTSVAYSQYSRGSIAIPHVASAHAFPGPDTGFMRLESQPPPSFPPSQPTVTVCNLARKWNLRFDGRKDPISFLERLEELLEAYSVAPDDILRALPELLTGTALLWYRNSRELWSSYGDFRTHFETQFLPPGYRRTLDEEIRKRTQGENESFRDFVVALNTLIRRRGSISAHDRLDLLYSNMRPDYKLMVRRNDFLTLTELIKRAEDYESYLRDKSAFRPPPPPAISLVPETAYQGRRRHDRPIGNAVVDANTVHWSPKPNSTVKKADKFVQVTEPRLAPPLRSAATPPATTEGAASQIVDREHVCWNCDRSGHLFRNCPRPRVLRCYFCKTAGISTRRCNCVAGNEYRVQYEGGRLNPRRQSGQPPRSGATGSRN